MTVTTLLDLDALDLAAGLAVFEGPSRAEAGATTTTLGRALRCLRMLGGRARKCHRITHECTGRSRGRFRCLDAFLPRERL